MAGFAIRQAEQDFLFFAGFNETVTGGVLWTDDEDLMILYPSFELAQAECKRIEYPTHIMHEYSAVCEIRQTAQNRRYESMRGTMEDSYPEDY